MTAIVHEKQQLLLPVFCSVVYLRNTICHLLGATGINRSDDFIEFELKEQFSHLLNVLLTLSHICVEGVPRN